MQHVRIVSAGEEIFGDLCENVVGPALYAVFITASLAAIFAPLWWPPVVGSLWIGHFLYVDWKWHPVFCFLATFTVFSGTTFLIGLLLYKIRLVASVCVIACNYGGQGGWLATYAGADVISSVVIGIVCAVGGALLAYAIYETVDEIYGPIVGAISRYFADQTPPNKAHADSLGTPTEIWLSGLLNEAHRSRGRTY
jgi:hypothetical protein